MTDATTTPTTDAARCEICGELLHPTERYQQQCAALYRDPECLFGHTSEDTAYVVDDYPYGFRLRCQIRYWIETTKHGQRFCSQTTNPKVAGVKWNKPKKSTYCEAMIMKRMHGEDTEGHISYIAMNSWPSECLIRRFERLLGDQITEQQKKTFQMWRVMTQAQKHIKYEIRSSRSFDLSDPVDRAEAAAFDATKQTKEHVDQVWGTAINIAEHELGIK